jgi:HPt (histidine-containing phosphotransfer) domain-containing protein
MNFNKLNEIKTLLGPDFQNLVSVYTKDTCSRIQEIETCIKSSDFNRIRHLAHAMKSSSANIGADSVCELASEMEELAINTSANGVSELLPKLKKAIDEAIQILNN